jgi:hypothetical protein
MRAKLLTTISFFTYQLSISQTEKQLHGKVVSQNLPLKDVEVINKTAKTSTTTNESGEFSILVNAKDSLIFFSKDYFFKRLKITQENMDTKILVVDLILRAEELDEVVITKMPSIKLGSDKTYEQEKINEIDIRKRANNLTRFITGYKDGSIPNGMSMTIGLGGNSQKRDDFKSEFKELVLKTCNTDFFINDLKLTPQEKALFLEFCDADPKSKLLLEHPNILATMDFLYGKNEEFKKLETDIRN